MSSFRSLFLIGALALSAPAKAQDVPPLPADQTQCTPLKGCHCLAKALRQASLCLLDTFTLLQRPGAPASLDARANLDNLKKDGLINPALTIEKLIELGVIESSLKLKGGD